MFHRESGYFKTSYGADMALYPLPIARWTVGVLAVAFLALPPLVTAFTGSLAAEYYVSIVNIIMIAVVGALGLNILVGYTGQISIGHAAFMSVGAYTAANLAVRLDLPFWVTLPAGGLMAAAIGVIGGSG
ncbi:MAG TPA: branched-chain amino acid ABC transporter permease, partial [Vineibacter sp.]|nr:branched-chain amino acid ABC transporter permease [Vineibacter sp.]